mmetsp:Transcript_55389/g.171575  ORF Transcript_55389/g.171575 Transcript_55389/m.171575 type:complete len:397 (+) Transcript_55389:66-1256(+)
MAAAAEAVVAAAVLEASSPVGGASLPQEPLPWRRGCSDPEPRGHGGPKALPWCPHSLSDLSTAAGSDQAEGSEPEELGAAQACAWRLVWCHERCHKVETEERRVVLSEAVQAAGASLVCLKKAAKFALWLRNAQRPPFILLTDWREVKPCLMAAAEQHTTNQPTFTVVLCEEPRCFERASAWAQSLLPRGDPVHVCPDLTLLQNFLKQVSARSAASVAPPLPPGLTSTQEAKLRAQRLFPEQPSGWHGTWDSSMGTRNSWAVQATSPVPVVGCQDRCGQLLATTPVTATSMTQVTPRPQGLPAARISGLQLPEKALLGAYSPCSQLIDEASLGVYSPQSQLIDEVCASVQDSPLKPLCRSPLSRSVDDVLADLCAGRDGDDLGQLLAAALPDHYDD